jgi:hypothetical protein
MVCSTYGREEYCIQGFGRKARRNISRRIILKWILEK